MDHKAKEELLPDLHLPDTLTYLQKMEKTASVGFVALPEYDSSDKLCNEGPSLRATMGLSLLDLPPHKGPVKTLIANVNAPDIPCAAYASAAVAWFGPTILKAASGNLIDEATCYDNFLTEGKPLSQKAAADTLGLLGNENTIAQVRAHEEQSRLQAQQNLTNCMNFNDADEVIARIQARLNAK